MTLNPSHPTFRPLPNPLGRNGPYELSNDDKTPIEQDCDRIEGHTALFRRPDLFELDLNNAAMLILYEITAVAKERQRLTDAGQPCDIALDRAQGALSFAMQLMQEARLIAEVWDDREVQRIRDAGFDALIPKTPRDELSELDLLLEDATLARWISMLLDRLFNKDGNSGSLPKVDEWRDRLLTMTDRLERVLRPATAAELQSMSETELSAELVELEQQISAIRRAISLIHAVRLIRKSEAQDREGA